MNGETDRNRPDGPGAAAAESAGTDRLLRGVRWLGHASFLIEGERRVWIDPWRIGPGPHPPADIVLLTHPHPDHCSPSDLERVPGIAEATIVAVRDAARKTGRTCRTIAPGEKTGACGVAITAVPAYNIDKPYHPRGAGWAGFLIETGGRVFYHAGDTDRIPEMRAVRCDVALLPVGGTYVMTAEEAAWAAEEIRPGVAVPMHWGSLGAGREEAVRFANLAPVPVRVLEPAP
ncbi:MAG: MBL fold metallo-hydrolase [Candidatus Eisenbacteria bacterium]|nr:MBL fold metallo-hydrolase [Candidatus Eisenbacteria bacterium]